MAKQDELHAFMDLCNKEFGDNTAIILDEDSKIDVDVVPTSIPIIDDAMGIGGFPRGRISEVYGAEGCGKTTICLHAIASAQKLGQYACFIDAEHALSPERMQAIGVDTSKLIINQPDSGEQALDLVEMVVRSGKFSIIVVDSVAALTPQAEVDKDMGESVMGVHARLMSQAMRKLTAPVSKHNVALVFTNQTRAKIGGYVPGTTTTGGNALKFYASMRLEMKFTGQIKNSEGQRVSGKYKMTVVKNKLAVPFKEAEFEINGYGIDASGGFIEQLVEKAVIEKSGAFYRFNGEVVAQGKQALIDKMRSEPDFFELLSKLLKNK
jgi:recombination protein RecA